MRVDAESRRILVDIPSHNRDMIAILEAVAGEAQGAPPP